MFDGNITALTFATFIIVLAIAVVMWLRFMRKPGNRHPMRGQRERSVDEMRDEASAERRP